MNKKQHKYKEVWNALNLITLGIILLLNTSELLPWRFWFELLKLWPVLLITSGISIILSGTDRRKFIADGIGYIVFLLAIIFTLLGYTKEMSLHFIQQDGKLVEYSQTIDDSEISKPVESLDLEIHAGKLHFVDEKELEDNKSISITGSYHESVPNKPNVTIDQQGEFANIEFESAHGGFGIFGSEEYDFDVSEKHNPKNLTLTLGAGDASLKLGNSSYEQIALKTGSGSVDIDMKSDSFASLKILKMDVGAGSMTLTVPNNIEYSVEYDVGVGSFENPHRQINGLGQKGTLNSDKYDPTKNVLRIQVKIGVGSLTLKEN